MQIVGGAAMLLLIRRERKGGAIILAGKYAEKHSVSLDIPYLLHFFPQVLLISVPAKMRVQFEGGNKTRAVSISLGSLEC